MKGTFKVRSEPAWLTKLIADMDGTRLPKIWFKRIPKQK
jgi:hypothetical protein